MLTQSLTLYDAPLPAAFVPTGAFAMVGGRATISMDLVVAAAAQVQFYLEVTDDAPADPACRWRRELTQEIGNTGGVNMNEVVRTIFPFGGGNLPAGTHRYSMPFERDAHYVRLQMRALVGVVSRATVAAPFGAKAI